MTKSDRIFELIKLEEERQSSTLMMIPSENYTYPEVRQAVGSMLMQKYAEGQPKKRYYQGMQNVDDLEELCENLALKTFGLSPKQWGANVQAYSGTPANLAVYNALLSPGDKIMAMYLPDGGHLSHGWEYKGAKITLVSKIWNVEFYHVDKVTKVFDYAQIEKQALKFKPKLLISGGTAYPREINHKRMGGIAHKVGAYYMADIAHEAGLVAGGANKSPFRYADVVTFTTHKTLRGPRGAIIVAKNNLIDSIDKSIFPGMQGGPHMHSIAGIAIALEKAMLPAFKKYSHQVLVNAQTLAKLLGKAGLDVVSGGTDKHLILIDLRKSETNGWIVAWALEIAGIIANRNTVPFETASPFYPSGLRLGTPAITVRGMKEAEMEIIADWIIKVIEYVKPFKFPNDPEARKTFTKAFREKIVKDKFLLNISVEVKSLCQKFPIPSQF